MSQTVSFSLETLHGLQLGKLEIPLHQVAPWINFLVASRQGAQILSAQQSDTQLTLLFQAQESFYAYLDGRFNAQIGMIHPENQFIGRAQSHAHPAASER